MDKQATSQYITFSMLRATYVPPIFAEVPRALRYSLRMLMRGTHILGNSMVIKMLWPQPYDDELSDQMVPAELHQSIEPSPSF